MVAIAKLHELAEWFDHGVPLGSRHLLADTNATTVTFGSRLARKAAAGEVQLTVVFPAPVQPAYEYRNFVRDSHIA